MLQTAQIYVGEGERVIRVNRDDGIGAELRARRHHRIEVVEGAMAEANQIVFACRS